MRVRWWQIFEDGGLRPLDPTAAQASWKRENVSFWADVSSYELGELDRWLRQIGASEPMRACCLGLGEMSRVVPLDAAIFFELPVHQEGTESELSDLGFLGLERLLVTLHQKPVATLDALVETLEAGNDLRPATTSGLVATLLLAFSAEGVSIAASLKRSVFALDVKMDQQADGVNADEILDRKRALRNLDTVVDEQAAVFGLLRMTDKPFLRLKNLAESSEATSRNSSFAERSVDRIEKHLYDLQQRYDATRQEKTNQRLALLTVISAIFLPLTLLTGIYGMNFDFMPELHYPYSYPVALGVMATIAVGLYRYFRSRGWLD